MTTCSHQQRPCVPPCATPAIRPPAPTNPPAPTHPPIHPLGAPGKPKGVLHTTGGYMVGTAATFKYVFDYRAEDVYWCTADCGWITGHSYLTYGGWGGTEGMGMGLGLAMDTLAGKAVLAYCVCRCSAVRT